MANEGGKDINDEQREETTFAAFLETVPPGSERAIPDMLAGHVTTNGSLYFTVNTPDLIMHCDNENCGGARIFAAVKPETTLSPNQHKDFFLGYRCRNCTSTFKVFAIRAASTGRDNNAAAIKFGEIPFFGPPTPARLIRIIGSDRETFLKGRRSENLGLGIGAFSYYRRVVENQKAHLFNEIRKAAIRLNSKQDVLDAIEAAKSEEQFSKGVDRLKDVIPDALKIKGHNPLTLVYGALSRGIHEMSDEECLERAQAIRVVLTELADRISSILKDAAELDSALTKLLSLK